MVHHAITRFRGKHYFLSNFATSEIEVDGFTYPTAEHAYQALKCDNQADREKVQMALTPAEAKRIGNRVDLPDDWDAIRIALMMGVVCEKFWQNPRLAKKLVATYPLELVEGNTHGDRYWGQTPDAVGILHGDNWLGRILMIARSALIAERGLHYE